MLILWSYDLPGRYVWADVSLQSEISAPSICKADLSIQSEKVVLNAWSLMWEARLASTCHWDIAGTQPLTFHSYLFCLSYLKLYGRPSTLRPVRVLYLEEGTFPPSVMSFKWLVACQMWQRSCGMTTMDSHRNRMMFNIYFLSFIQDWSII